MHNFTLGDVCFVKKGSRLGHMSGNSTLAPMSSFDNFKDLWGSPRAIVARIEVLVGLAAIILLFLGAFGSHRRRCNNFFIQKGVLGAYTLSFSVVAYTLGSMQSSEVRSSLYPIWALSLYILFGCADSITAYNLEDNRRVMMQLSKDALYYLYILLIVFTVTWNLGSIPVVYLLVIGCAKFKHRMFACRLASKSWSLNKMVADYMMYQEEESGGHNPVSMEGYRYLVDWPIDKAKLKTAATLLPYTYGTEIPVDDESGTVCIDKVWQCNQLECEDLKDTCLSFSLFHLLRRRFFGFPCAEASQPKTHDFVFKGLLASKDEKGCINYNRVFKVIDVELAFMYDFFFTKRAALYYGSSGATLWSYFSVICMSLTAYLTFGYPVEFSCSSLYNHHESVHASATPAEAVVTAAMPACIALIESMQLLLYWTTIWGRVSFVCRRVRRPQATSMLGLLREILVVKIGVGMLSNKKHYWQDKIGQYSLLESVGSKPSIWGILLNNFVRLVEKFYGVPLMGPALKIQSSKHVGKRSNKSIKLTDNVKEALVQTLTSTNGELTNGRSFLVGNGAQHLLWAWMQDDLKSDLDASCSQLEKENQAGFILTWHIATCYCEMGAPTKETTDPEVPGAPKETTNPSSKLEEHRKVATGLSKYCAYLVVSRPKLLPGHHCDTRTVFLAVAEETADILKQKDKHETINDFLKRQTEKETLPGRKTSVLMNGVKLGQQLEDMVSDERRWKVLADFWTEMTLYLAPSENVKDHIKCLARGGELITHLWALLSHAGILDRGRAPPAQRSLRASTYPRDHADELDATATPAISQPATHGSRRVQVQPM